MERINRVFLHQQQPDIVLLDLLMPHLDGFAVIEHLRQAPNYRELPVIVLTAKTLTAAEHTRLDQSVRTVIQKRGLEHGTLIDELQSLLRGYRDPIPQECGRGGAATG